jgi:hypothetical protein
MLRETSTIADNDKPVAVAPIIIFARDAGPDAAPTLGSKHDYPMRPTHRVHAD